jgi:hypothetical protein
MVSECANPNCKSPFRFLHGGRIYRFNFPLEEAPGHHQDILWDANGTPRRTELFWLCETCVGEFTLVQVAGIPGVKVERLETEPGKAHGI